VLKGITLLATGLDISHMARASMQIRIQRRESVGALGRPSLLLLLPTYRSVWGIIRLLRPCPAILLRGLTLAPRSTLDDGFVEVCRVGPSSTRGVAVERGSRFTMSRAGAARLAIELLLVLPPIPLLSGMGISRGGAISRNIRKLALLIALTL